MAEVTLAGEPVEAPAAVEWLKARMAEMGAVPGEASAGVAGSVEASMRSYMLPDGAIIEVWSDNYTALSLRGDAALVDALAAEYRKAHADG